MGGKGKRVKMWKKVEENKLQMRKSRTLTASSNGLKRSCKFYTLDGTLNITYIFLYYLFRYAFTPLF